MAKTAATVKSVKGSVTFLKPGESSYVAVRPLQELLPGSRIRTGDDGYISMQLKNGSLLELKPNSSMMLSAHERKRKKKSSVLLVFGRLWSKITSATGDNENYEVNSANAVAGVRGTEFETQVGVDGSVRVSVTKGKVAVGESPAEDGHEVGANQMVEGNEAGVDAPQSGKDAESYEAWSSKKEDRLRQNGGTLGKKLKSKILSRKEKLQALRQAQKELLDQRAAAEKRLKRGDKSAADKIRSLNNKLASIADQIAAIGDQAESQFGLYDKYAELANAPGFGMIGAKYIKADYENLKHIKDQLDAMVAEGTDISMKAMDDLLDDMGKGKFGTLKDDSSAGEDLFGDDPMGGF
jgi:hypothetical protein